MLISIASAIACSLLFATVLILRGFRINSDSLDCARDFSWTDFPLERVLDPAEIEFLRSRGVKEARIRRFRAERRRVFRLCLRSLAKDFKQAQHALKVLLVQSAVDRPDLASGMIALRLTFYRNMVEAKACLLLHACGVDRLPTLTLLQPLQEVQARLQELATTQYTLAAV